MRRWSELMSIAVRTGVEPLTAVDVLRHELRGAAGDQVLYETRTLKQLASATLARQRSVPRIGMSCDSCWEKASP